MFVLLREIITALEADTNDLPAIAGMTPGVVAKVGIEPEVEILRIQWAFDKSLESRVSSGHPRRSRDAHGTQRVHRPCSL